MPHFNFRTGLSALIVLSLSFMAATFLSANNANAASNSFSYADNKSSIVLTKPSGTTYSLKKQPIQSQGKDDYRGAIIVTGPDGKNNCSLGVQILVNPGQTSGAITAPAFANGLAGAGSAGGSSTPSCTKNYAAGLDEYNRSITVSTSGSGSSSPSNPETSGQKEGVITVYSKTATPPSAKVTMTSGSSSDDKSVNWNGATGSARFEGLSAGTTYKFCVTPANVFDTTSCKSGKKVSGSPLSINFGSASSVYNEDGKVVTATVVMNIPADPKSTSYGPVELTVYSSDGTIATTGYTGSQTYGSSTQPTVAQKGSLVADIDGVEPGSYKICAKANEDVCASFTKKVNEKASVTLNIPDKDVKALRSDADQGTSCSVDGIGWFLCPVANAMAGMTDSLAKAVSEFLKVKPLSLNPNNNPTYNAWSYMRSVANVAFVIVFLVIIFSQLTSLGVSNYGVKKLLPRLVVGAILVNASFFIVAIAVDISNVLGYSVQSAFNQAGAAIADTGDTGENWGSITSAVLAGSGTLLGGAIAVSTLASGGIWGVLAGLLPLLVGALFALFIAFLVLLARQAFIIMLIILAPLAFVAYLLPNTEGLFKKWRGFFFSLLALFPIFSALVGGSSVAAIILRETAKQSTDNALISFFLYVGSFAVQAIPFFITPILIKFSSGLLGRFAGLVNNVNKGPFDRMRKGTERIAQDAQNRGYARKVGGSGIMNFGARRRARVERISKGLSGTAEHNAGEYFTGALGQMSDQTVDENGNKVGGYSKLGARMAAGDKSEGNIIASRAVATLEAEELKNALQPLLRQLASMDPGKKREHLQAEVAAGGSRAAAAVQYAAQVGDTGFLRKQIDIAKNGGESVDPNMAKLHPSLVGKNPDLERKTREAINANAGSVIGKAPDLVKGPDPAFSSIKGSDIVQFKPDTAKAFVAHLRKLQSDPTRRNDYEVAIAGFNNAIQDVKNSSELQGQFSAEVGSTLQRETASDTFRTEMTGLSDIDASGKVR